MSTKPVFRFYLKDNDVDYVYWHKTHKIPFNTSNKTIAFMEHGPVNWDDVEISLGRNNRYLGLLRGYSGQYQFVKEAADILRSRYYENGLNATMKLVIDRLNSTTQEYEFLYEGDLAFDTVQDEKDFFGIEVRESGVIAKFRANEDTEYEIDVAGNDTVLFKVEPQRVLGKAKFLTGWPNEGVLDDGNYNMAGTIVGHKLYINYVDKLLVPVSTAPLNEPVTVQTQSFEIESVNFNNADPDNHFLKANVDIYDVKVYAEIPYFFEIDGSISGGPLHCRLVKWDPNSNTYVTIQTVSSPSVPSGGSHTGVFTINPAPFNLLADERLVIYLAPGFGSSALDYDFKIQKNSAITVDFEHYTDSFTAKGMRWFALAERLISKMTDGKGYLYSPFLKDPGYSYVKGLDNRPYDTIVTCGDAIRGVWTSGHAASAIKIKFSDLFKDGDITWSLGLAIEGNAIVIRPKAEFFNKDEVIYDLGEVADFKVGHAMEYAYSRVKVGYPDQEYDEVNGRDEFNTNHLYNLPLTEPAKDLDMISPIRADMHGIVRTWVNYALSETKDSDSDNDVFKLEISPVKVGSFYPALRLNGNITGVIDLNNAYNIGLSPKRCLLRNGGFIRSFLLGFEDEDIEFERTYKNIMLATGLAAGQIDEVGNVTVRNLAQPFFKPFIFDIQVQTPKNLIEMTQQKAYGCFRFTMKGHQFKGFPMNIGVKPGRLSTYNFKLLCTPDADFFGYYSKLA